MFLTAFLKKKKIYYRLKSFLEQHNTLYDSQRGFREKRSTEHALLDIINQIETNMGAELYSCGIFIDLRKTFDMVDHQILLSKLHHCILGRQQTTQIGANNTSKEKKKIGRSPSGVGTGTSAFSDLYKLII